MGLGVSGGGSGFDRYWFLTCFCLDESKFLTKLSSKNSGQKEPEHR